MRLNGALGLDTATILVNFFSSYILVGVLAKY